MTYFLHDEIIAGEHYTDLVREAEQERLIRQAFAGIATPQPWHRIILEYLGRLMVKWGLILQRHNGTASITPLSQLLDRTP